MRHLRAGVVVVVLALDLPAGPRQHARQAVAERGVAAGADVQRAGRVGADELDLHAPAAAHAQRAEASSPRSATVLTCSRSQSSAQREVEKPGWRGLPTAPGRAAGPAPAWPRCAPAMSIGFGPRGPTARLARSGEAGGEVAVLRPRGRSIDRDLGHRDLRQQARLLRRARPRRAPGRPADRGSAAHRRRGHGLNSPFSAV